tara:strand:+ start:75 stop:245 length:171 start_codon:yes stop_codon:yes gene_type:complete
MNKFELKNIKSDASKTEKRKTFFRSLIKPVQAGANGTLDYVVKEGSGKNKIASKKQ